jgi:sodium/potassium-transporting ATPase subunit beta
MLAVFMALSPRDHPRYILDSSRMRTRSNPLSPGLGFRPQPEVDKNLIVVDKDLSANGKSNYVNNLNHYLDVHYWTKDKVKDQDNAEQESDDENAGLNAKKFRINNPRDCTTQNNYGFPQGKPCVLVKMNKIVGFEPKPGTTPQEKGAYQNTGCQQRSDAISVHCYGEYPADVDNVGNLTYISEDNVNDKCGTLQTKWFPYEGKYDRRDFYQAPYIWVQFNNPKPNVLINVLCRVYGQNIDFDRKSGRALTRFQIYVDDLPEKLSSSKAGEV